MERRASDRRRKLDPMASAQLSRRVAAAVPYPPLCEMGGEERREFHEALLEALGVPGAGPRREGSRRGPKVGQVTAAPTRDSIFSSACWRNWLKSGGFSLIGKCPMPFISMNSAPLIPSVVRRPSSGVVR